MHYLRTYLLQSHVEFTFEFIQKEQVTKLVGLLAHFVYWAVFGGFNPLPIDGHHLDQIIIAILDLQSGMRKEILEGLVKIATDKENQDVY